MERETLFIEHTALVIAYEALLMQRKTLLIEHTALVITYEVPMRYF